MSISADSNDAGVAGRDYAPYAQLVKMLVPSSGSIALYDCQGEMLWCSDGCERPDLRELVEAPESADAGGASIRTTSSGVSAFAATLCGDGGRPLGRLLIELSANGQSSSSVTASLLRPVLECLQSRLNLEKAVDGVDRRNDASADLDLLISVDDAAAGDSALQRLVAHTVEHLDGVGGAFVIPEKNLGVVAIASAGDRRAEQFLDRTQKHLLAWAQLNNRPMVVNRVPTGGEARYKILSCPVRDPGSRVVGLMALFRAPDAADFEIRDVRILEFISRKAMTLLNSQHDPLTGLVNRLIFERKAQQVLDAAPDAAPPALFYVDIDRLEAINDAFGLHAGDEVIQRIAAIVRASIGTHGLATRIGGDRFVVMLQGDAAASAATAASEICAAAADISYLDGDRALPVSVSIGLAAAGTLPADLRHAVASAELACKRVTRRGGNGIEAAVDASATAIVRSAAELVSADLQRALDNNELRLEAQPIVDTRASEVRIRGYEVLVRMRNARGEHVAPDRFLGAAESHGLMAALDRWVVATTIEALRGQSEMLLHFPLGVAINISAQSLGDPGFVAFVGEELTRVDLPAEALCFEIKESTAIADLGAAERLIGELARLGCRVALDDFGRGLSSLAHLKRLKVHYLKIDGGLVRRLADDLYVESMVRGLSQAAQTLGVAVVAEHVETAALADKVRALAIDYGQGFLYGRPAPLGDVIDPCADAPRRAAATLP
jgi:diguanylate cyclase (GGDEF)-like protein